MSIALPKIDRSEVLRYLGYGDNAPDALVTAQLQEAEQIVERLASPLAIYRLFGLERDHDTLRVSGTVLELEGEAIRAHLMGADQCILLAATLGMAVDQELRRIQVRDMALAAVLDATANAAIEQFCDSIQQELAVLAASRGLCLTTRFSPGYGDLPLTLQRPLCVVLDAGKIGVGVSDLYLLSPRKSVTAILGLCREPVPNQPEACAVCTIAEHCNFRKAGTACGKSIDQ